MSSTSAAKTAVADDRGYARIMAHLERNRADDGCAARRIDVSLVERAAAPTEAHQLVSSIGKRKRLC